MVQLYKQSYKQKLSTTTLCHPFYLTFPITVLALAIHGQGKHLLNYKMNQLSIFFNFSAPNGSLG